MCRWNTITPVSAKQWCVSKPSTPDHELRNNIKFVCEEKRMTDCSLIQSEGPFFNPNTAINHDSAMISRGGSRIRTLRVSSESVSPEWCVLMPSTPDHELRNNIKFVCEEKRMTGCSLIQSGGPCFNPNTAINHASVASFGGSNIDHSAWEDKKNPSKSRFPVQVASFGGSNIDLSAWEDKKNPSESRFPTQQLLGARLSNDSKSCLLKPSIKRLLAAESPQGVLHTPDTVAKSSYVSSDLNITLYYGCTLVTSQQMPNDPRVFGCGGGLFGLYTLINVPDCVTIAAIATVSNRCNSIYRDDLQPLQYMKIGVSISQKITVAIGLSMATVGRNRHHISTYGDGLDNRRRNRCDRPITTPTYGMLAEPLR
ncbi:B2 protein [Capsicum annuum]|nr:B2 protein [Capsicum annuum]